jgi:hypothetical protein
MAEKTDELPYSRLLPIPDHGMRAIIHRALKSDLRDNYFLSGIAKFPGENEDFVVRLKRKDNFDRTDGEETVPTHGWVDNVAPLTVGQTLDSILAMIESNKDENTEHIVHHLVDLLVYYNDGADFSGLAEKYGHTVKPSKTTGTEAPPLSPPGEG